MKIIFRNQMLDLIPEEFFLLVRCQHPKRTMGPSWVVETFNIFEDGRLQLFQWVISPSVCFFFLEILEETLTAGIVKRIAQISRNACITGSTSGLLDMFRAMTLRENGSMTIQRQYHLPATRIYVISLIHTRLGAFWLNSWWRWLVTWTVVFMAVIM